MWLRNEELPLPITASCIPKYARNRPISYLPSLGSWLYRHLVSSSVDLSLYSVPINVHLNDVNYLPIRRTTTLSRLARTQHKTSHVFLAYTNKPHILLMSNPGSSHYYSKTMPSEHPAAPFCLALGHLQPRSSQRNEVSFWIPWAC